MKTCKCCGQEKPFNEFYKSRHNKDGHQRDCKNCQSLRRNKKPYQSERKRKWTENDLIVAVSNSSSYAEILSKLDLAIAGGNYKLVQSHINRLELDISHLKGQGWNRNNYSVPLEDILTENSSYYDSSSLKKRLFREKLLENKCYECGLEDEWNSLPISLQLDHINGIKNDNRIENLRILCPNCHFQTKTWGGKNIALKRVTPSDSR